MNSNVILKEDRPTTSSIEIEKERMHWRVMPPVSSWCSQQVSGLTATTSPILEPIICYVTAPRLDSTWFVDISVVTPRTEVIYRNQLAVERFLGDKGKRVLERVLSLADNVSQEQNWPLSYIEIKTVKDSEVKDWQYILVIFNFACDFMTADGYLHDFCRKLDSLTNLLDEEEEDILRRMLFFDAGTTI